MQVIVILSYAKRVKKSLRTIHSENTVFKWFMPLKGISPKVNTNVRLMFKLFYYDIAVQYISNYAKETTRVVIIF